MKASKLIQLLEQYIQEQGDGPVHVMAQTGSDSWAALAVTDLTVAYDQKKKANFPLVEYSQ